MNISWQSVEINANGSNVIFTNAQGNKLGLTLAINIRKESTKIYNNDTNKCRKKHENIVGKRE